MNAFSYWDGMNEEMKINVKLRNHKKINGRIVENISRFKCNLFLR